MLRTEQGFVAPSLNARVRDFVDLMGLVTILGSFLGGPWATESSLLLSLQAMLIVFSNCCWLGWAVEVGISRFVSGSDFSSLEHIFWAWC